jgi:hypothetical protein
MTDKIYHYCSNSTFLSIITGQSIHLNPMSYANDPEEGVFLIDLIPKACRKNEISENLANVVSVFLGSFPSAADGFAMCFSEAPDMLSQWRAYADSCRGFCIGFDVQNLQTALTDNSPGFETTISQVIYGTELGETSLQDLIATLKLFDQSYPEAVRLRNELSIEEALHRFNTGATMRDVFEYDKNGYEQFPLLSQRLAPFIKLVYKHKSRSYEEEKEWRAITHMHKGHHRASGFRVTPSAIRPYTEVSIKNCAGVISDVLIGPMNTSDPFWISELLESKGFHGAKVRKSSVKIR